MIVSTPPYLGVFEAVVGVVVGVVVVVVVGFTVVGVVVPTTVVGVVVVVVVLGPQDVRTSAAATRQHNVNQVSFFRYMIPPSFFGVRFLVTRITTFRLCVTT